MVEIMKGKKRFTVPAGSVEVYKGMGFRVVKKGSEPAPTPEEKESAQTGEEKEDATDIPGFNDGDAGKEGNGSDTDANDEEKYVNELLEKPISQWSNDEVKEFVRIKDIDTSGAQKVSQVRSIIKTYLEEQNKNS